MTILRKIRDQLALRSDLRRPDLDRVEHPTREISDKIQRYREGHLSFNELASWLSRYPYAPQNAPGGFYGRDKLRELSEEDDAWADIDGTWDEVKFAVERDLLTREEYDLIIVRHLRYMESFPIHPQMVVLTVLCAALVGAVVAIGALLVWEPWDARDFALAERIDLCERVFEDRAFDRGYCDGTAEDEATEAWECFMKNPDLGANNFRSADCYPY